MAVLDEALRVAHPEISNTDQGSQFTSEDYLGRLEHAGVRISMDGQRRFLNNISVERLWRTVKYEDIYLRDYEMVADGRVLGDSSRFITRSASTNCWTIRRRRRYTGRGQNDERRD
ncbi:MAG: hypothetical protein HY611_05610 [Elusimicrobia bacterium]|nr:hypothetical protein [Elusimicrobiota bacterium]